MLYYIANTFITIALVLFLLTLFSYLREKESIKQARRYFIKHNEDMYLKLLEDEETYAEWQARNGEDWLWMDI